MKQTEVTIRFLEPDEGMVLRHKDNIEVLLNKVALAENDSIDNYEEIDEATALAEKEQEIQNLLEENEK